jgi:hypothetical protein
LTRPPHDFNQNASAANADNGEGKGSDPFFLLFHKSLDYFSSNILKWLDEKGSDPFIGRVSAAGPEWPDFAASESRRFQAVAGFVYCGC